MEKATKTTDKKRTMLNALEKSLGVVTSACLETKIDRTTHYRWLKEDEEYKRGVEDIENIAIDFVESKLYGNIKRGDVTSILFFLKTKGKKRGYIERQEIDHTTNGKDINKLSLDFSAFSTEELLQYNTLLEKLKANNGSKQ